MVDQRDDEVSPTPEGLLRCLLVLSEEAACLSLSRTFAALQDAVAICRAESDLKPALAARLGHPALIH